MSELVNIPSFIVAHLVYSIALGLVVNEYEKVPVNFAWPSKVYPYWAGITGGLIGGVAMALVGVSAGFVIGHGPWYPINLLAATAIRSFQELSPDQLALFRVEGLVVGTVLHFAIALAIGLLFTIVLPAFPGHPLLWSLIFGGVLWVSANIILLFPLNPVMAHLVDVPSFIIAHVVYTILLGLWVNRYEKIAS
jgi:hypothetical protein